MTKSRATVLQAQQLCCTLQGRSVLQDVSFRAEQGDFIGIIGPNGAGKSTLLRCLRGLGAQSSGSVRVQDNDLSHYTETKLAQTIAYMQQDVNFGFGFTALDVVLAGRYPHLKWWQNESEEDRKIARSYMDFAGVGHLANVPLSQVSGGERQRVLLAKVLTQETPLIFLDEPTASLDLLYQEEIFRACQSMCRNGKTVLLVAHDLKLAAKFCSRLLLLAKGKCIADGTAQDVITEENLRTAYGLHASVYLNQVTGNLDIHTYDQKKRQSKNRHIHVIGGGGAAARHLRLLHAHGYRVTSGVLQEGDSDYEIAVALGMDIIAGPAFSDITPELGRLNRQQTEAADWTLLSNCCFGIQNIDNLKAAASAKKLIIIEDSPIQERDFSDGAAALLYLKLRETPGVLVLTTQQFQANIADIKNEGRL